MTTTRQRGLAIFRVICVSISMVGAGCADGPMTGQANASLTADADNSQEALTGLAVERVIPIRFVVLSTLAKCQVSDERVYDWIRLANETFLTARVQFAVKRIYRRTNFRAQAPFPFNQNCESGCGTEGATYPDVAWDPSWVNGPDSPLGQLHPNIIGVSPPPGALATRDEWLGFVAQFFPHSEIPVFITCDDQNGSHASFPSGQSLTDPFPSDWSHALHIDPQSCCSYQSTLAHEVGHFLGLGHTWDSFSWTGAEKYYDLIYGHDTVTNSYVRTFTSAADAAAFKAANPTRYVFRAKDTGCTSNSATGYTYCPWAGFSSGGPNTLANMDKLQGLMFPLVTNTKWAGNIMSYMALYQFSLSTSQVESVTQVLRNTVGNRNLLGRVSNPMTPGHSSGLPWFNQLDFDGDGLFDPAYWKPSDKSCHYVRSIDGVEVAVQIPSANPAMGDVPVPDDYDNDGKTDCAVFRPGASPSFRWRGSSVGDVVDSAWIAAGWGVPVFGVQWFVPSGQGRYHNYGIYNPDTATFYYKDSGGTLHSKQYGNQGDQLLLGQYDADGLTDIAVWRAWAGLLSITTSSTGFTNSIDITPAGIQSTDVPVGGVDRDGNGKQDFAYWRPSTGTWHYVFNPGICSPSCTTSTEQWGISSDYVIGGFDFDGDGKSDPAVYRPASPGVGGDFWVKKSAGGTIGLALGIEGDVPFVTKNRYGPPGDKTPSLWLFRPHTMTWIEARGVAGTYPASYALTSPGCVFSDCTPL